MSSVRILDAGCGPGRDLAAFGREKMSVKLPNQPTVTLGRCPESGEIWGVFSDRMRQLSFSSVSLSVEIAKKRARQRWENILAIIRLMSVFEAYRLKLRKVEN